MTLDAFWQERIAKSPLATERPDFRFNPSFYLRQNGAHIAPGTPPETHWKESSRPGNDFTRLAATIPDLAQRVAGLVTSRRLKALLESGHPEAPELAFELILLGAPHDAALSDFSAEYYLACHPGLCQAGAEPFLHYIQHGIREGRRTLRELRRGYERGEGEFRPRRRTCLLALHDFSRTGAPLMGLELLREAARRHNVVAVSLTDGPLREDFSRHAVDVIVTDDPVRDLPFCESDALPALDFAVLNSVEALPFARLLLRDGIPYATRVNEYSDYMLPAHKPLFTALFSDLLVFPAAPLVDNWRGVFAETGFDVERDLLVLPQRNYVFGGVSAGAREAGRARLGRMTGAPVEGRRIVLGAGVAHWRKGADLFALTAQAARARGDDTLFVWIGDGRNPEDFHSGVWLERHLAEAGVDRPEGNLFFLPTGEWYDDIRNAADAFYLPARLDPLPNVVFEAAEAGCHTVLFRGATGFDDPLYEGSEGLSFVPFGDVSAACDALLSIPLKIAVEDPPRAAPKPLFEPVAAALAARLADQRDFVIGSGAYDVPVMASNRPEDAEARLAEREKIWSYGRRFLWSSADEARACLTASENWVHARIGIDPMGEGPDKMPPVSVHMHAYYVDELGGDLLYYRALREAKRLVVTTDTEVKRRRIDRIAADAGVSVETHVFPNTGRDVLPFLRLFAEGMAGADETWCHVHQKKAPGTSQAGGVWKRFQMVGLLGGDTRLSPALSAATEERYGLVAPFDPYRVGWSGARALLPRVAPHLPGPLPEEPVAFPVGNMFHVRGTVALRMAALFGEDFPWPNEPLPNDGTVFHLIERLWPAVAAAEGLDSLFLDNPGQRRS